ncbi:MAG TPA: 2-phospho-L-lactate guanylyltransferase [Parvularculaceae bacterium]|nr:2-phospho-L-lactate guanylyltransferase [Parvularculaceae bacterium]
MITAIVPLKNLDHGKSRLRAILNPLQRRNLSRAMAHHVCAVLRAHNAIDRVLLVSSDHAAEELARLLSVEWVNEAALEPIGAGARLNAVLRSAVSLVRIQGSRAALIVHADLPLLTAADIDAACETYLRHGRPVIGADIRGEGTNLLLFDASYGGAFAYGEASFERHLQLFPGALALANWRGALDIDTPADLAELDRRLRTHGAKEKRSDWGSDCCVAGLAIQKAGQERSPL